MEKRNDHKQILILMSGGVGDIVLSIPAIRALRKGFQEAYITCLIPEKRAEIMQGCPYVNEVMSYNLQTSLFKYIAFCLKLRHRNFEIAFMFKHPLNRREQLIPYLAGVPQRIGPCLWGSWLQNHIPIFTHQCRTQSLHQIKTELDIVKSMGIERVDNTELEICIPEEERDFIQKFLWTEGVNEKDLLIGIHPGASWKMKRWTENNFAVVGDILSKKYGAKVIITVGSTEEVKLAEEMTRVMEAKPIVTGKINLLQLAALIKRCNIFLTNDTGPMHIAAAVGTPLVALFGPTEPLFWAPLNNERSIVLRKKELICGPRATCEVYKVYKGTCYELNHICSSMHSVCINSISVSEVVKAAEKLLERGCEIIRINE